MAVVTPLNNPGGPEGDTVTVDEQLLNTEYHAKEFRTGTPPHPLTYFVTPCMHYLHRKNERRGDCSVLGIRTR